MHHKREKLISSNVQPFLRWAGSKRKQVPLLSTFWRSDYNRYVEPFMGSACLFFAVKPEKALLADINADLIKTFIVVRDHPRAVFNRLRKIPLGKRSYYAIRKMRVGNLDPIDATAQFIFLNRFCFNGLYRTNEQGFFNVPFAASKTGRLPLLPELIEVSKALQNCEIRQADFEDTLRNARSGDFVFLDPPYAIGNRRVFRQYGPSSFGLNDLQRLAQSLIQIDKNGAKFVLSYAYCSEALKYFSQWPQCRIFVQRNIAGFATHRRLAAELLISNCFPNPSG